MCNPQAGCALLESADLRSFNIVCCFVVSSQDHSDHKEWLRPNAERCCWVKSSRMALHNLALGTAPGIPMRGGDRICPLPASPRGSSLALIPANLDPGLKLPYCSAALFQGLWDGLSCSQPKHLITAKISTGSDKETPSVQGSGQLGGAPGQAGCIAGGGGRRGRRIGGRILSIIFLVF